MVTQITRFHGDYGFLSNFYPCVVTWEGADYSSVEHAFQAAKTHDLDERYRVQTASAPGEAKRLGRRVTLRDDWEAVKLGILEELVRQKFTRYPELGAMLLATGDAELIEGNTWNDRFYGCVWSEKQGRWLGKNHLGQLLMCVREELKGTVTE
jgi:N-glycosidase YbiA